MDNEQLLILLNNKLNSLNEAIASAMQAGNIDAVNALNAEVLKVRDDVIAIQSQE